MTSPCILRRALLSTLTLAALATSAFAVEYKEVPDWYKLEEGRAQMGSMHGDIALSSKGEVYVSVMDPAAAMQVYGQDGKFLRNIPNMPPDFHGFVIRKDADGEFIYGPRKDAGNILKYTLDGKEVLNIPSSVIPDEFKFKDKDGKPKVMFTAMDVAPNGDMFVTDGYSSDYVHKFDKTGKYLKSFGGKAQPYGFKTLHKIAIDTRFDPPRIIGCDRANNRMVHMSLDGEFLGVIAKDLLRPAAVTIHGDNAVVGELNGQVTVLDKAGQVVAKFGTNTNPGEAGSNKPEPAKWQVGIVTAPHGVVCNERGDVFVAEYSLFGRMHRFNRQ